MSDETKTPSSPKIGWRAVVTFLSCTAWLIFSKIYDAVRGPLEGSVAVGQLSDDPATYAAAREISTGNLIPNIAIWSLIVLLAIVWGTYLVKKFRKLPPASASTLLVLLSVLTMSACGPAKIEVLEEIDTNETAFLVPLEGNTDAQGKFMSEDYLNQNKVGAKRVSLPQRQVSTGRMWWAYKYVPTMRVVKVDRTPVTREWTEESTTGTSTKDDALAVESKDSIGFSIGATITAMIEEDNAAKFLYYYAGKPLPEVVDENVRSFVKTCVGQKFGDLPLEAKLGDEGQVLEAGCKDSKVKIFAECAETASKAFSERGISIVNLGYADGLSYDNPQIQQSIDNAYVAEMAIKQRENEKISQEQENERLLGIAQNERAMAEEFARAKEAWSSKIRLEIENKNAEARLVAANKWNGQTPTSILPQGTQMLFGLDQPAN